jgi:lambda family phage minor tail protein L
MALTAELRSELASLSPSSVIELYEIETSARLHGSNEVYRFTSTVNATYGLSEIEWNTYKYWPFPIEAEGFSYSGKGTLPRPTVRVANTEGAITSILAEVNAYNPGNDLIGAKFTRIRTLARFLDHSNFTGNVNPYGTPDPLSTMPDEVYYVDRKSMECRDLVEFELVARYDLTGIRAPKRQCLKRCGWIYKGDGCGYRGSDFFDENDNRVYSASEDKCGHRLTSCKARFGQTAQLPYGGFPGIGNYNF